MVLLGRTRGGSVDGRLSSNKMRAIEVGLGGKVRFFLRGRRMGR